jgi:hypothetical protein
MHAVQVAYEEDGGGEAVGQDEPSVPESSKAYGHSEECAYRADNDRGRVEGV